jgi:hypothetical protein
MEQCPVKGSRVINIPDPAWQGFINRRVKLVCTDDRLHAGCVHYDSTFSLYFGGGLGRIDG